MYSQNRLDPFSDADLAGVNLNRDDLEAAEHVCAALVALRERSGLSEETWAQRLGLEVDELRMIENGRVLDQPSGVLLYRAARVAAGELKIGFTRGAAIKF